MMSKTENINNIAFARCKLTSTSKVTFALDYTSCVLERVYIIPRIYEDPKVKKELFYQPKEYEIFHRNAYLMKEYQGYYQRNNSLSNSKSTVVVPRSHDCHQHQTPYSPPSLQCRSRTATREYRSTVNSTYGTSKQREIATRLNARRQRLMAATELI